MSSFSAKAKRVDSGRKPCLALGIARAAAAGTLVLVLVAGTGGAAGGEPTRPQSERAGRRPAQIAPGAWKRMLASIERDRYTVQPLAGGEAGYRASNRAHGLSAEFRADGVRILVGGGDQAPRWKLRMARWGLAGQLRSVQPVAPQDSATDGRRLNYRHGAITEWWVNDTFGLEQGFTIAQRPDIAGGVGTDADTLVVELESSGTLRAVAEESGTGIVLRDQQDSVQLRYQGLVAWDADGRRLPARMRVHEDTIQLHVEAAAARYPVTIDPLVESAKIQASDKQAGDQFGWSVAVSGDTAIVGAPLEDTGGANTGAAYVFDRNQGGANNWGEVQKIQASDKEASDQFGYSVAISTDTAIVGARNEDTGGATPERPMCSIATRGVRTTGERSRRSRPPTRGQGMCSGGR